MAGTGKSTVSRTVASTLAQEGNLAASFFFKRGEADRASVSKFFTTTAADLVNRQPATAPFIKDALDNNPAISSKTMREQFDKLIVRPARSVSRTLTKANPIIIVIDALDECEAEDDIRRAIHLLSEAKNVLST
jgi:hypothetical protein